MRIEHGGAGGDPAQRRQRVVHSRWPRVLGRPAVVNRQHRRPGSRSQPPARPVMRRDAPDHPAASVEIHNEGDRSRHRPVQARRHVAGRDDDVHHSVHLRSWRTCRRPLLGRAAKGAGPNLGRWRSRVGVHVSEKSSEFSVGDRPGHARHSTGPEHITLSHRGRRVLSHAPVRALPRVVRPRFSQAWPGTGRCEGLLYQRA